MRPIAAAARMRGLDTRPLKCPPGPCLHIGLIIGHYHGQPDGSASVGAILPCKLSTSVREFSIGFRDHFLAL